MSCQAIPVWRDSNRVPMLEAYVCITEINVDFTGIRTSRSSGGAVRGRLGWWRLLDSLIDKVAEILGQ